MPWNQKQWIKALKGIDYQQSVGGRHAVKMVKEGRPPITLPHHKGQTYSKGLDAAIRKQAGL